MDLLKNSVQTLIEKDRIGSPVFLRIIFNIVNKDSSLLNPLSELSALSNAWIPSQPERVFAKGEEAGTQVTVMIQYTDGQMAVLAVNRVDTDTAIDMMLVGNKGVIYHETPIGMHYLSGNPPEFNGASELSEFITQSLEIGQPIIVEANNE